MTLLLLHPKLGSGRAAGYISPLAGSGSCSEKTAVVFGGVGWVRWVAGDISLGHKEALGC